MHKHNWQEGVVYYQGGSYTKFMPIAPTSEKEDLRRRRKIESEPLIMITIIVISLLIIICNDNNNKSVVFQ